MTNSLTKEECLDLLLQFSKQRIMIVGDVGLDEYVNGAVRRISPEAPVPVLEVNKQDRRIGLSGNVAQNITSLGAKAHFISVLGEDNVADEVCEILKNVGVDAEGMVRDPSRPTTRKLRVMTGHHHIVRIDFERRQFLSPKVEKSVVKKAEQQIDDCHGLIIQDYAKGVLSENLIQNLVRMAKEKNIPVFVDPHRTTPLSFYKGATVFKPNIEEAIALSGLPADSLAMKGDLVENVGKILVQELGCESLVLTRGKEGASIFSDGRRFDIPTEAKQVYDVTGAGDTVIATLALAYCSGLSIEKACRVANIAAGIVVSQIGCVPCKIEDLRIELQKTTKN